MIVSTSDDLRFDPRLALRSAERALALAKPDSRWAQVAKWRLGRAWYHVVEREKALACVQAALDSLARL